MQPTAGFMTHVTYRLTAKNRDQLRNPMLGNRVWATFLYSLRTNNALDALYRVNKYVLIRRLKQSVLLVGSQIKSGSELDGVVR